MSCLHNRAGMESELERQLRALMAEAEPDNDVTSDDFDDAAPIAEFRLEWSPLPWNREAWETVTVQRRPILLLQVA